MSYGQYVYAAPLEGWIEDIVDQASNDDIRECLAQANATTSPLDTRIADLIQNWRPTGIYTVQQVRDLVSQTMRVVTGAQGYVDATNANKLAPDARSQLRQATAGLVRKGSQSLRYLDAAREAEQKNIRVLDIEDLKTWVVQTMTAASSAVVTAYVVSCTLPMWVAILAAFQVVFDGAVSAIKTIGGTVIEAGEQVIKVAALVLNLTKIMLWGGVVIGGLYLYKELFPKKNPARRRRRRRR